VREALRNNFRIIVGIAVIAAFTGCSRRTVDDAEHADYRVRAIEEFERLTSSKDYVYLHYIAAESGKRAAALRSIDRQLQGESAASLQRIETAFHDSISQDIISGELFPLEPGHALEVSRDIIPGSEGAHIEVARSRR
jgi:hypothetical protein